MCAAIHSMVYVIFQFYFKIMVKVEKWQFLISSRFFFVWLSKYSLLYKLLWIKIFILRYITYNFERTGKCIYIHFGNIVATAFAVSCMTSMGASAAPQGSRGAVLGALRSLGALARALGPLLASTGKWALHRYLSLEQRFPN